MDIKFALGQAGWDYENIVPLNSKAGMSDLFLAHKKGLNVDVVIKRMRREAQSSADQRNESEILKTLKHQYLPQIYDVILGTDGFLYTVMDFIRGVDLQGYVEKNGPVSQKQAYLWGCQLCEAVQYLHQAKGRKPTIIHCDIKPRNIMITDSGDVCLIDFGTSLISREGMQAGAYLTHGYAAPEQYLSSPKKAMDASRQPKRTADREMLSDETVLAPDSAPMQKSGEKSVRGSASTWKKEKKARGSGVNAISEATDVYAIGATLYFAVTGKRPKKALEEIVPLSRWQPAISKAMADVITRAMSKAPEDRFQDAAEMRKALQDVPPRDNSYRRYLTQKIVLSVLLSAAFAVSFCSMGYGLFRMRSERENTYLNLLSQAEEARSGGSYEEGKKLLEAAIRQQPSRADAYLDLAVLLYQQGQYQPALDLLDNALRSGSFSLKEMDSSARGELYYIQGSCLYELKRYEEAILRFRAAAETPDASATYYRGLAIAYANNGQIEEAQETLEQLTAQGASSSDCDVVSAEIAAMQKAYAQALSLYQKVFAESDDPQLLSHAYLAAAQLCSEEGELERAADILEQALEALNENNTVLQRTMLADLYIQLAAQNPDEAEEYDQRAESLLDGLIRAGVGTLNTRLNMAAVQQSLGNYAEAEESLLELQQMYPQDYQPEMRLAYLYIDWQSALEMEQRDYQRAQECYESAREKYQQALANGQEDQNMTVLKNLVDQLKAAGWLE